MSIRPLFLAVSLSTLAVRLGAQAKADTLQHPDSAPQHVAWVYGVSTGALGFGNGGHERAVSAAVGANLPGGFSLSVNPTYAWAQAAPSLNATTGKMVTPPAVHGMADLPVSVGYSRSIGNVGLGLSLGATFPTGDTTTVGSGQASYGASVDMSVDPVEGWSLSAGAGHSLSNDYATSLGGIAPTSVSLGGSHQFGVLSLNAGYSTELGAMPAGTTHSQSFSGGAAVPIGGDYSLTLDGSTGRADGAQSWALAIGLGTTFAGVSSVSPFAAAKRLATAFGKGRSMGNARSAAAKAAAAARKAGHNKKMTP